MAIFFKLGTNHIETSTYCIKKVRCVPRSGPFYYSTNRHFKSGCFINRSFERIRHFLVFDDDGLRKIKI